MVVSQSFFMSNLRNSMTLSRNGVTVCSYPKKCFLIENILEITKLKHCYPYPYVVGGLSPMLLKSKTYVDYVVGDLSPIEIKNKTMSI